jgi:hypothetical protein
MMRKTLCLALSLVALAPAVAQEAAPTSGLALELNAVQASDTGCRITFLATNGYEVEISRAAIETALFAADGAIDRIVTLDFKALAPGKTKVLQFGLSNLDCASLGRVLINDITVCDGTGVTPETCLDSLAVSSRTDIQFGV